MSGTAPYELSGTIAPTRVSGRYRLGLFVVAVTMIALPLLYLALIVLVGQLTVWHLRHDGWLIGRAGGIWGVVAYFGPAIAGVVMMFFMIKPILARTPARVPAVSLRREDEPLLFRFIDDICAQVRAPQPARVDIDCDVNAAAGFDGPALSLRRRSLVLTIGLPLAAGLTVRELGGVIAHEFGHFAQGSALRLTSVVRSLNRWFSRVVYERDAWDEKLARGADNPAWFISLPMRLAQAAVWCSRQILRGLMNAGHAISCYMLRQMEYDADSYEVKLVGTATFLETSARMRELNVQSDIGHDELQDAARRLRLPDDLPAFLMQQRSRLTTDAIARIREIPIETPERFDTHPTSAERAAAAEALAAAGVLRGGHNGAVVLFRNFDAVCRAATRHYYEHRLGIDLAEHPVVDTELALRASRSRHETQRAFNTFFGEQLSWRRPVRIAWPGPVAPGTLAESRAAVLAEAGAGAQALRKLEAIEQGRILAAAAEALLQTGFATVIAQDFDLTGGTMDDARSAYARAVEQEQELTPAIAAFEALVERRLIAALTLAAAVQVDAGGAAGRQRIAALVAAVNTLADAWPMIVDLYRLFSVLEHLAGNVETAPHPESVASRIETIVDEIQAIVQRFGDTVGDLVVTVSDDAGEMPLRVLLQVDEVKPGGQSPTALVDRAISVRLDLLGRLAAIALNAEGAEGTSVPSAP